MLVYLAGQGFRKALGGWLSRVPFLASVTALSNSLAELMEQQFALLRGHRVMLSTNLARLYEVEPRALVQGVKRNIARFPEDFGTKS